MPHPVPSSTHCPPLTLLRRRAALVWLLLALVLAPALARMHQVLHLPGAGGAPALAHPHGAGGQALDALHALFANHGDAGCQVLDQQTLVGPALGQGPALVQAEPQRPPAAPPAATPAQRRAAPFHARAPPVSA